MKALTLSMGEHDSNKVMPSGGRFHAGSNDPKDHRFPTRTLCHQGHRNEHAKSRCALSERKCQEEKGSLPQRLPFALHLYNLRINKHKRIGGFVWAIVAINNHHALIKANLWRSKSAALLAYMVLSICLASSLMIYRQPGTVRKPDANPDQAKERYSWSS